MHHYSLVRKVQTTLCIGTVLSVKTMHQYTDWSKRHMSHCAKLQSDKKSLDHSMYRYSLVRENSLVRKAQITLCIGIVWLGRPRLHSMHWYSLIRKACMQLHYLVRKDQVKYGLARKAQIALSIGKSGQKNTTYICATVFSLAILDHTGPDAI